MKLVFFNEDSLNEMCGDDVNFKIEVAYTFSEMTKKDIEVLKEAISHDEKIVVKARMHKLKSSLDFIGAQELSKWANKIEDVIGNNKLKVSDLNEDITAFIKVLNNARKEMESLGDYLSKEVSKQKVKA